MARPTKLTPALQARIVKHVARGAFPEVAAQAEGICERTYYYWMSRGEAAREADEDNEYLQFLQAIERARARDEITRLTRIKDDRWVLEKTRRERYGQRIDIGLKDQAFEHVFAWLREELDPETFGRLLERRASEGGEEAPSSEEGLH